MNARLRVLRADITTLRVDAIVNAANELMLGGGGVDGAIHRAAGRELRDACRSVPELRPGVRCPTGESRITPASRLAAKWVIHTVGPIWRGGGAREAELLGACYRSSLQLALDHRVETIAFPAISCGVYRFPVRRAAQIASSTISHALAQHEQLREVTLVAFDAAMEEVLSAAIEGDGAC
ncbi:MAG: O-acetyl-ADP-ribose deacetylase [Deltaproteobacteria bacterium]|nr:O-acetyl-ADP-ribose deacetylase [Deltaproteobacteria bacterium]